MIPVNGTAGATRISPWGRILDLLRQENVTELEVVGRNSVWISRTGNRERVDGIAWRDTDSFFDDFDAVVGPHMYAPGYKDVRECSTLYEGGLTIGGEDGYHARLHMMLPPTSVFPQVTIAKRSESLTSLDAMVSRGSMSEDMARFLRLIVRRRQTIVFSGGGGSGKTTMLRACCNYLSEDERVIVCEDTPELSLPIGNVSYLESIPWRPGIDPNLEVKLSYLVAQANRMRCDRIIVGETRSSEFHGFLQSANSGYSGSMTTLHANSPQECVTKMNILDLDAIPGRDTATVNRSIAQAVDFIVQLKLLSNGKHVVESIYSLSNIVTEDSGSIPGTYIFEYSAETGGFHNHLTMLDDKKSNELGIVGGMMPDEDGTRAQPMTETRRPIRGMGLPLQGRRNPRII